MMKPKVFNRGKAFLLAAVVFTGLSFKEARTKTTQDPATLRIVFSNKVGARDLVLRDSTYENPFGESYTVTRFRYYVTDIFLGTTGRQERIRHTYFLIDQGIPASWVAEVKIPAGSYHSLGFLLGVDSLLNVSGAQTGVLDPMRDMFWTWNSGYVMAKMEGNSPASTQVNQKFEYHIGGYSGPHKVLQTIRLPFDKVQEFHGGETCTIYVDADLNAWWKSVHEFRISEHPVITTPGLLAREMSENYAHMFHIDKIVPDSH
ncbi:MAG: hypothetical protein KGM98_03530 [Bacteroidota bacterium]|nr:hypothetical protein [Bacteroidota bacterium]